MIKAYYKQGFKKLLPYNNSHRSLAKSGMLVAHIQSHAFSHGASAASVGTTDTSNDAAHMRLHIGLQYLSPLRSTFLPMEVVSSEVGDGDLVNPEYVVLRAGDHPLNEYEAFAALSLLHEHGLQFYHLIDNPRPITRMCLGELGARRWGDRVCFWVPKRRRGKPVVEEDSASDSSSLVLEEHTEDELDSAFWELSSSEGGDADVEAARGLDPCGDAPVCQ
jgi:hypothetical protein